MALIDNDFERFLYANYPDDYNRISVEGVKEDVVTAIKSKHDRIYKVWKSIPDWIKNEYQDMLPMDLLHGNVQFKTFLEDELKDLNQVKQDLIKLEEIKQKEKEEEKERAREEYRVRTAERKEKRAEEEKSEFIAECVEKGYSHEVASKLHVQSQKINKLYDEIINLEDGSPEKAEKIKERAAEKCVGLDIAKEGIDKDDPLRCFLRQANEINGLETHEKDKDIPEKVKKAEEYFSANISNMDKAEIDEFFMNDEHLVHFNRLTGKAKELMYNQFADIGVDLSKYNLNQDELELARDRNEKARILNTFNKYDLKHKRDRKDLELELTDPDITESKRIDIAQKIAFTRKKNFENIEWKWRHDTEAKDKLLVNKLLNMNAAMLKGNNELALKYKKEVLDIAATVSTTALDSANNILNEKLKVRNIAPEFKDFIENNSIGIVCSKENTNRSSVYMKLCAAKKRVIEHLRKNNKESVENNSKKNINTDMKNAKSVYSKQIDVR